MGARRRARGRRAPIPSPLSSPRSRLILMRHAHSDDASPTVRDHARSITPAGARAAAELARALADRGWLPDLVLASDAARSRQTVDAMAAAVPALREAPSVFAGALYTAAAADGATARALAAELAAAGPAAAAATTVLAIGHNRGWEETATSLAGGPVRLATASAALLESGAADAGWPAALVGAGAWSLVGLLGGAAPGGGREGEGEGRV